MFHFLDSTENQALWDELASYKSLKFIKYLQLKKNVFKY